MQFIQAAGLTMHYELKGDAGAPLILFANSLGTDLRIWDEVVAELRDDHWLLRYDMRGHGLTDTTPGPYSIPQLAEDAVALLDALGIGQAHLCGISIGGMVAQQLAATRPQRVQSAIFCDTALRIGTPEGWVDRAAAVRRDGLHTIADGVVQRWFTTTFPGRDLAGYRNMLCRSSAEGYAACCEAIGNADLGAQAASVQMPSLVVVGSDDLATTPDDAAELDRALPDSRLVVLADAAHLPCIEQPRAVSDAIRGFLQVIRHG